MKTIYTDVMHQLKSEVTDLKWIELDTGQLKLMENGTNLPITYPCCLISINIPECINITDKIQNCKGVISITLAFEPILLGQSSNSATTSEIEDALQPYNTITDVYKALQGFETKYFNALSRKSQRVEFHENLFVYKLDFSCEFEDLTADIL